MKLIVGLGNPGKEYDQTRHNAGFTALDLIRTKFEAKEFKEMPKFDSELTEIELNSEKVILAKPTTFMNNSGLAVAKIMQYYKIKPQDLIVIYDDLDLELGQIRIRKEGSAGTHNGMKSIIENIGLKFPRIRIGIESRGKSAPKEQDTSSFVLSKFSNEEAKTLAESLEKTIVGVKLILEKGLEVAMNTLN